MWRCLGLCNRFHRLGQNVLWVNLVLDMVETVLVLGRRVLTYSLNIVSGSYVAAGELNPSGVTDSYAPYIGLDGTKGGNISVDKFCSGRARGSYLQSNVIPNSEYRDNVGARREFSEYLELTNYEGSSHRAGMCDEEYRSSCPCFTGPLVHPDITVQDGQSTPMQ